MCDARPADPHAVQRLVDAHHPVTAGKGRADPDGPLRSAARGRSAALRLVSDDIKDGEPNGTIQSAGTPDLSTASRSKSETSTWNGIPQRELTKNPLPEMFGADQN